MKISIFGASLLSTYRNSTATYFRGMCAALHKRGHAVTFYESDVLDRQGHRDSEKHEYARSIVYAATDHSQLRRCLEHASHADLIIKTSDVGANDALLEQAVVELKRPNNIVAYWDVDAPATTDRIAANPRDTLSNLLPRCDLVITRGGGEVVCRTYESQGVRRCVTIASGLDPKTHRAVRPEHRFAADVGFMGNCLEDRMWRAEEFVFRTASLLPGKLMLLAGFGWNSELEPLPANVNYVGHVGSSDHNAFNSTPMALLNVTRDSAARSGDWASSRLFETAGAGACIVSDNVPGIERFFEPGREILTARSSEEAALILRSLTPQSAREFGRAAHKRAMAHHTYDHRAATLERLLDAAPRTAKAPTPSSAPSAPVEQRRPAQAQSPGQVEPARAEKAPAKPTEGAEPRRSNRTPSR